MLSAVSSVLIADAEVALALRNADANGKMLVCASVVRCAPVMTLKIGVKPSPTVSPGSAVVSKTSQMILLTDSSENQPGAWLASLSILKPKSWEMPEKESRYCGSFC